MSTHKLIEPQKKDLPERGENLGVVASKVFMMETRGIEPLTS